MIRYANVITLSTKYVSVYLRPQKRAQAVQGTSLLKGNFATALPSFIDKKPAREYLQTIEKSELLCISRKDFYNLVETMPEFAKIYTRILELGFIIAQKRIYGFQGFDALEANRISTTTFT